MAVFCRNHKVLLDQAVQISQSNSQQVIPFRSKAVWRSAEVAIKKHGPMPIYFLPIGDSEKNITVAAILKRVIIDPVDTEEIRDLLAQSVQSSITEGEGLWSVDGAPTVRTLYVVSNCRQLSSDKQIRFTQLMKLEDNQPIDQSFGYSYAIVHSVPSL